MNKLSCHCYFIKLVMSDEFIRFRNYKNRGALRFRVRCVSALRSLLFCAYQTPYELCLLTYIITPLCTPINNFKERTALIPTHPSHLMLTYDCTESQGCFNVLPLSQIFDNNFAKREINQFTVRCRTVKNGKECPWKGKLRKIEVSIR